MTITVCKDCQECYPACWGSCTKYLEAKIAYEKRKAEKRAAHHIECAVKSVQYTGLKKHGKEKPWLNT